MFTQDDLDVLKGAVPPSLELLGEELMQSVFGASKVALRPDFGGHESVGSIFEPETGRIIGVVRVSLYTREKAEKMDLLPDVDLCEVNNLP
jgi:hypothetical protein